MIQRETTVYLLAPRSPAPPLPSSPKANDASMPIAECLTLIAVAVFIACVVGFGLGLKQGKALGPDAPTPSGTPGPFVTE